MDEQLAWRSLRCDDEKLAQCAFADLQKRYQPALRGHLRNSGVANDVDRDDLISQGFLKLWMVRERVKFPTETAGKSYLYTTVNRCMIDWVRARSQRPTVPVDTLLGTRDEPVSSESPESQVVARVVTAQLLAAANCLWLGLDASLLPTTHTRQLLVAQLYYLEGCSVEEIIRLLQAAPPSDEPRLTLQLIRQWLSHAGVIRLLAYDQLYYETERLLTSILGVRKAGPDLVSNLWKLAQASRPDEPAFNDLTWAAVAIAIMRYQLAVSYDDLVAAKHEVVQRWGYCEQQIAALLDDVRGRLPFSRDTEVLLDVLERRAESAALNQPSATLGEPSLWQRLAFQYKYMLDLAQKDILERVQQPAGVVGYVISEDTLNSWISGRRLQKRLLQYWKELYGDQNDG